MARRRGTAMTEMVLVCPFLILIFVLLMFFGRGMVRVQHAQVMGRYEAWRQASVNAPGPHPQVTHGHVLMNQTFFNENADGIGYDANGWFPPQAADALIEETNARSADAGALATDVANQFPRGRTVRFTVNHDQPIRMLRGFEGSVRHRHTKVAGDWRFANRWRQTSRGEWEPARGGESMLGPLRDVFYDGFDLDLQTLQDRDNGLAAALRRMYLAEPGYRGPTVWTDPFGQ